MTAPVQDPPETLGILFCHFRRRDCDWGFTYRTADGLFDAEVARHRHELDCRHRPTRSIGTWR